MTLTKSMKIVILLIVDLFFLLVELFVGYKVHSLALVAGSVYMLNDVLSLCVGLWAIQAASRKNDPKVYTYGWQRADTLRAFIKGVFLLALCVFISLGAISRFFEPQEVSNPELVGVVGCFGLLSHLLGLVLLREHGHSHGHQSERGADNASEVGKGGALDGSKRSHLQARTVADEGGNGASRRSKISTRDSRSSNGRTRESDEWPDQSEKFVKGDEDPGHGADSAPSISTRDHFSIRKSSSDSDDDGEGGLTPLLRERNSPATGADPTTTGSQHENLDDNRPNLNERHFSPCHG